mmetsp:Transcript_5122/g.11359  ORF Transcript_5122/g.11359 Transcript_5122/m.11359 type:complete len:215 (+) Transcript_5122:291-935(+)
MAFLLLIPLAHVHIHSATLSARLPSGASTPSFAPPRGPHTLNGFSPAIPPELRRARAPQLCARATAPAPVLRGTGRPAQPVSRAELSMQMNQLPRGGPGFDLKGLVWPAVFVFLLTTGTLGFVFNFLNGIFLFLFVAPLIATPIFNWWLSHNLLEGTCPNCASPVQVIKGQQGQCFACGATMSSELSDSGVFLREGAASREKGVVDVDGVIDID